MAIYLVENHPGNEYISNVIDEAIERKIELVLFDFLPIRVFWILTSKWKVPKLEAREAVLSFIELPNTSIITLEKEAIREAFTLAEKLNHDIYDTIYVLVAIKNNARGIITTDTDFKKLCQALKLQYVNPVPENILKKFHKF